MRVITVLAGFACLSALGAGSLAAATLRPFSEESFSVGTAGPACEAQGQAMGTLRTSVYDRQWAVLCADVAKPVGTAFVLRDGADARIAAAREETLDCASHADATHGVSCTGKTSGLPWRIYRQQTPRGTVIVEGYAAYNDALRLTFASLVEDRLVPGTISIANLGSGDALALARARAGIADPATLIGQGYRGNGAGSFAEAAEFFAAAPALFAGTQSTDRGTHEAQLHESLVNRALQLSNLGSFDQAASNFTAAKKNRPARSGANAPGAQLHSDRRDQSRPARRGVGHPCRPGPGFCPCRE